MSRKLASPIKSVLRNQMKRVINSLSQESVIRQSKAVTEKVLKSEAFRLAQRISIYLSTPNEVDTTQLLKECFRLDKHVYVPRYEGISMDMLRLKDLDDYESLPLTKWNIKQPSSTEDRENALSNGEGIDLFLLPGVAFSLSGGRLGHGMGYYDNYLRRHQTTYPQKKTTLMALAFREQIVDDSELPLEHHDVKLHTVITE